MKKLLLLFPAMLCSVISISQENWNFSASAGVNMVPIQESDISGTTFKGGLAFAFTSSHKLEEGISFDYGLAVNQRFATYSTSSTSDELNDLLNLGAIPGLENIDLNIYENINGLTTFWTIDLPLTMTYKFKSGIGFFGGGYLNYLMTVKNKEQIETYIPIMEVFDLSQFVTDPLLLSLIPESGTVTETNDSEENMNEFGFGVLAGVSYQTESWILKLGYQHGLNEIRSDEMEMKIKKQRAVQLSVGILIQDLFYTSKEKPKYDLDLIE